ncbi:hypothetical protein [Nonomuraea sp. LPB2021202275-12-8]|uniref:hypothetical protein n=1 Tax=Nonomuraea sp. LPB2021202275-12-8 TaxID=3120159 RepID=UPI00300CBE3F
MVAHHLAGPGFSGHVGGSGAARQVEVLHQLDFAYTDLEPVYEECLRDLSGTLGLDYSGKPDA